MTNVTDRLLKYTTKDKLPIKVQGIVYRVDKKNKRKILCLKRSPEDGGFWHILTGTLEQPTESLFDCLQREVEEEIGVNNIKSLSSELHRFLWEKNNVLIWVFTYAVEVSNSKVTLNEEHTEYKWLDISQARKLLKSDSAKEALTAFASQ